MAFSRPYLRGSILRQSSIFVARRKALQLSETYYAWLAGFIVLSGLSFILKGDKRKLLLHLFLVYATLFVGLQTWQTIEARKNASNEVFVESDKAELSLRLTSSLMALGASLKTDKNKEFEDMQHKFYLEAENSLNKAIKLAPESSILLTKRIILHNETQKPIKDDLDKIEKIDTPKAKNLSKLTHEIYIKKKVDEAGYKELSEIIHKEMTPGWYQNVLDVQLEKVAGHEKEYDKKVGEFVGKYANYLIGMAVFMAVAALSGLFGVFVILAQLFMLPRTPTSDEERAQIQSPADWGWKTVYAVFIAWMSTEYLVGPLLKDVSKNLANIALERGSLTVAFLTATLYLSQNLPSLFYIWYFALKQHGIKYLDGIRLRFKTERRGPVGLVFAGALTWYAAIPLVLASTLLAQKFLNSNGSSNPIVAVVLSSVKDANPFAVIMFLITLGILPAICEETLFRGFLYTSLRRKFGVSVSIFISALLFSMAHFDPGGAVPLFVLGALFAFVFERTKSLVPAMVAHCMWNSGTFLMALTMLG